MNPDLILEARKLCDSGAFDRKITMREPEEIQWDRATLECGHSCPVFTFWRKNSCKCLECVNDWIKARS